MGKERVMTEKGCDNCYYTYFDEKAYPCSLCIRGIERTDKWQPSKKTKADRKTEPQTEKPYIDIETGILHWCGWKYKRIYEDEPQTDCSWK
jgi:hypothetical protein